MKVIADWMCQSWSQNQRNLTSISPQLLAFS